MLPSYYSGASQNGRRGLLLLFLSSYYAGVLKSEEGFFHFSVLFLHRGVTEQSGASSTLSILFLHRGVTEQSGTSLPLSILLLHRDVAQSGTSSTLSILFLHRGITERGGASSTCLYSYYTGASQSRAGFFSTLSILSPCLFSSHSSWATMRSICPPKGTPQEPGSGRRGQRPLSLAVKRIFGFY